MYSHQRSKVTCMWKIIFVECRPVGGQGGVNRDPNAIAVQSATRFFSNTCQKMRGGKHVKVKKWVRAKTDFRVHRDPLDHLSVKRPMNQGLYQHDQLIKSL